MQNVVGSLAQRCQDRRIPSPALDSQVEYHSTKHPKVRALCALILFTARPHMGMLMYTVSNVLILSVCGIFEIATGLNLGA